MKALGGNRDGLSSLNLVCVRDAVGLCDLLVLIGIAVEVFADLGEIVAGLDGVGLRVAGGGDLVVEIGVGGIYLLDCVPDTIRDNGRRYRGLEKQLVAVEAYIVDLRSLCAEALDGVNNGCVFLLKLIEICHANLLLFCSWRRIPAAGMPQRQVRSELDELAEEARRKTA